MNERIKDGNWLLVYRDMLKQEWYNDSKMVHIFIELIMGAYFKEDKFKIGNHCITVKRGQYPYGNRHMERVTGIHRSTIASKLDYFTQDGLIKQEEQYGQTIITICNYDSYQFDGIKLDQGLATFKPDIRQDLDKTCTTNKEDKESKEGKELKEVGVEPPTTEIKSFTEKEKERLVSITVEDQDSLVKWYYDVLNVLGINAPNNPNAAQADYVCSKCLIEKTNISLDALKIAIYDYVYKMCINASVTSRFVKKSFSPYQLELKYLLNAMQKLGYVGYADKKGGQNENKIDETEIRRLANEIINRGQETINKSGG